MRRFLRFFSRWQNWLATLLILGYFGVAIGAPYISPDDPKEPGPFMRVGKATRGEPQPPDEKAILGMLPRGIDVYHALVWGARDALQFGLIVTISTAFFGIFYGALSGVVSQRVSRLLMNVADSFLAFPPIAGVVFLQQLFAATVTAMGGRFFNTPQGQFIEVNGPATMIQTLLETINPLMLSLIIFSWMPYARLVNSIVLTLRQTDFVQASRALGGSPLWLLRKHLLPNSIAPALVLASRDVGGVVLLQATLTFINIGGDSVWGSMLAQARNWVIGPGGSLLNYWWVFLPPTLAVMLFGIAWNLFGDGLNDVLVQVTRDDHSRGSFWDRWRKKKGKASTAEPLESSYASAAFHVGPETRQQTLVSRPIKQTDGSNINDPMLLMARESFVQGDLQKALHAYGHLIQHGRLVSEILPDLAQMVKKYPHNPQVWRTFGDALTRVGDLVHASQSYEQARKYSH